MIDFLDIFKMSLWMFCGAVSFLLGGAVAIGIIAFFLHLFGAF